MRRFRNPRYAPEGLERKLNPSGFAIPVAAEVAPTAPDATASEPTATTVLAVVTPQSLPLVGSSMDLTAAASRAANASAYDPPPSNPSPTPAPAPTPLDPWSEPLPPNHPDNPD